MEKPSSAMRNILRITANRYGVLDLRDRSTFLNNLVFVYHVIVASEQLLRVAMLMTPKDSRLHRFYEDHLAEERGHAEWLAQDLVEAGVAKPKIPQKAVELVGAQYYLLFHVDPCALIGYMAMLEGSPMPLNQVEHLESLHGEKLCRTLRYHAVHDRRHSEDLYDFYDTLDRDQQLTILENAVQTTHLYGKASRSFRPQSAVKELEYASTI